MARVHSPIGAGRRRCETPCHESGFLILIVFDALIGFRRDVIEIDRLIVLEVVHGVDPAARPFFDRTARPMFLLSALFAAEPAGWCWRTEVCGPIPAACPWRRSRERPRARAESSGPGRTADTRAATWRTRRESTHAGRPGRPILAGTGLADRECPPLKRLGVELLDDGFGDRAIGEFHERETAWPAGFPVDRHHNVGRFCHGGEMCAEVRFICAVREVPDEQTDCQNFLVRAVPAGGFRFYPNRGFGIRGTCVRPGQARAAGVPKEVRHLRGGDGPRRWEETNGGRGAPDDLGCREAAVPQLSDRYVPIGFAELHPRRAQQERVVEKPRRCLAAEHAGQPNLAPCGSHQIRATDDQRHALAEVVHTDSELICPMTIAVPEHHITALLVRILFQGAEQEIFDMFEPAIESDAEAAARRLAQPQGAAMAPVLFASDLPA